MALKMRFLDKAALNSRQELVIYNKPTVSSTFLERHGRMTFETNSEFALKIDGRFRCKLFVSGRIFLHLFLQEPSPACIHWLEVLDFHWARCARVFAHGSRLSTIEMDAVVDTLAERKKGIPNTQIPWPPSKNAGCGCGWLLVVGCWLLLLLLVGCWLFLSIRSLL